VTADNFPHELVEFTEADVTRFVTSQLTSNDFVAQQGSCKELWDSLEIFRSRKMLFLEF